MPPTFVTLFGTIWLPNNEELCNAKLTYKQARPSVTVKSRTKQLFIESYSGSRQSMLQLHQTWQTKFSIKWPFSGNKKLYTSKEVKEFPKMLQRSILSDTKTRGNQFWDAQETHQPHALSAIGKDHLLSQNQGSSTAYSTRTSKVQVLNDQASALFMLSSDGSGRFALRDKGHYCLMHFCKIANFLS